MCEKTDVNWTEIEVWFIDNKDKKSTSFHRLSSCLRPLTFINMFDDSLLAPKSIGFL